MNGSEFPHVLYHNDLNELPVGSLPLPPVELAAYASLPFALPGGLHIPVVHPSWHADSFQVVERGLGKYIELRGSSPACENRLLIAGDEHWRDYCVRGVVTPLSFDDSGPAGGCCGIVARYRDSGNYLALVLDRDGQVKLLQRRDGAVSVLASKPLEICLGQSMTLTLIVEGARAFGSARPYGGETKIEAALEGTGAGKAGLISDVPARFGPFNVSCSAEEAQRVSVAHAQAAKELAAIRERYPKMRLQHSIPLHGLVNGRNLRVADVNGDGQPEIIVAQSSAKIAAELSLTRITCLSVLNLNGEILWQAGVPDPNAPLFAGDLPFQVHDLLGEGIPAVICVFGYDVQVRDGKTGNVLASATTPETWPVGEDFKRAAASGEKAWGDETLNMVAAQIAFCDTQGNGVRREILVQDDQHHLMVLDPLSEPYLHPLFRHRGNGGCYPWIADIDGDGKDEILAGFSLLDDDGRCLWSVAPGGRPTAVAVVDPLNVDGSQPRVFFCTEENGLLLGALNGSNAPALRRADHGKASRLAVARFRADVPGLQIITAGLLGNTALFKCCDATGKLLWSREISARGAQAIAVNWTGQPEELLLYSMVPGAGLLDGRGRLAVEAPASGPRAFCDTTRAFSADGRDTLLAWDAQTLAVYVPDDAPLSGKIYQPVRPGAEQRSAYKASVSLPA